MSVITRATALTQDEVRDVYEDTDADWNKVLFDNHGLNESMNNILQCAKEEARQGDQWNCADANEVGELDISDKNQKTDEKILSYDCFADFEFSPMISTKGKHSGSTKYIYDGYVYARDGYTRSFRCSNRKLYECPGRAMIKNEKVIETKAHSHPREPHILRVEQVKQEMLLRAQLDKFIGLRTIYLEACKTEPLVRSHLGLDMMLNKMKKVRKGKLSVSPKPYVKPLRKLDLDFGWARDWLEVPSGQDKIAFCKLCAKDIVLPTKVRIYNHFLSKMHKHAVLGVYRPHNKRLEMEKQDSSVIDDESSDKRELSDEDSDQEDTYDIEVLDQFQDEVERMKATRKLKKRKINDHSSFYEQVIKLQTNSKEKNNSKPALNDHEPRSISKIKSSMKNSRMPTISVHVWDANTSQPTSGLGISLHKMKNDAWNLVYKTLTDHHGKCFDLLYGEDLEFGRYKLHFDTQSYYFELKQRCLYPYIEIVFDVQRIDELHHFPVQLTSFGYNVCRLLKS